MFTTVRPSVFILSTYMTRPVPFLSFDFVEEIYSVFYRLFEEKYGIAFVRRSTVGVGGQFCGRFRLLGIQKY